MSTAPPAPTGNPQLDRIASSMFAVKEFEGDGRILHDSYTKPSYTARRHGFLGIHPDYRAWPQLLMKANHEANQVFESQAGEISSEQVRNREILWWIEPLLPFPTTSNTDSLNNFQCYGPNEWTAETGHPVFVPSPQPSPTFPATEPNIEVPEAHLDAELGVGGFVSDDRIIQAPNAGQNMRQPAQTVTAGQDPDLPTQQTTTNTASQDPFGNMHNNSSVSFMPSAMDQPQVALNRPENKATMDKLVGDLGAPPGSLTPSNAPEQYQKLHRDQQRLQAQQSQQAQQLHQIYNAPQAQHIPRSQHEVSAVQGRAMHTPVKKQNNGKPKRPFEDVDANPNEEDAGTNSPRKRPRMAAKEPRAAVTAGEDPIDVEPPLQGTKHSREDDGANANEEDVDMGPPKKQARMADVEPRVAVTAEEGQIDLETSVRGTKRFREDDDTNAGTSPPTKRTRTTATKAPRATKVTAGEDPVDLDPPARRPATVSKPPKGNGKGQAKADTPSVASSVSQANTVNGARRPTMGGKSLPAQATGHPAPTVARRESNPAIVSGNRLPKSKAEAADAVVARKQALMEAFFAKNKKNKSIRHPDLMPEFFDTYNFTPDEKDPKGEPAIRCVCMANVDIGGEWIGCDNDECRVWQHVPCMGEAVPASEARQDGKYLCQQCDPFAHRKLIQRLRKNNPLP